MSLRSSWRILRNNLLNFGIPHLRRRQQRFPVAVCLVLFLAWLGGFRVFAAPARAWTSEPGGRSAGLSIPASPRPGFALIASEATGVTFTNTLSKENAADNQIRLNGSGVAVGDIDGDGWCDLYFCSLEGSNKLYRNLGDWRFEDITEGAGVACARQWSTGAVFADVDGDGDLDLLVNGIGAGTRCFLNDGKGHFTEALDSGLLRQFGSTSLALADIDGDGDLDLYVANYRTTTIRSTGFAVLSVGGKRMIRPEDRDSLEYSPEGLVLEHGEPHLLYLNDGHGRFAPMSWTNGAFLNEQNQPLAKVPRDWGLTVAFRDLNGDLAPDIYVANDFHSPDRIWMNDGHGHFKALDSLAVRHTPTFSMAVDFADLDRDGYDDFLALDMLERTHAGQIRNMVRSPSNPPALGEGRNRPQIDRNTLQRNRGDGTFAEISLYAGLEATGWTWSLIFLDVDLDGFEDVLFATGNMFNPQDLDANQRIFAKGPFRREMIRSKLLMYSPLPQPKLAFRNQGNWTFRDASSQWGFDQIGVAHGMAVADLDNDGDLDVIVNSLNGAAGLYRNETSAPRLGVRLNGLPPNTRGIGAKIKVLGGPVPQSQEMICGGRYLSGDDAMRVFAAGSLTNDLRIEVAWRNGRKSVLPYARANRVYELDEAAATEPAAAVKPAPVPSLFQDVSAVLHHTHHDEMFDDFARQPLLPNKLSQLGPGAGWFDIDGDGWMDLLVGSGQGGRLSAFQNDTHGGFKTWDGLPLSQVVTQDLTGLIGWHKAKGQTMVLAGMASYENGSASNGCARQFNVTGTALAETLPGQVSSTGPLALGDPSGQGNLALFVGGRVIPGRYPEPASSFLFQNAGGSWILNEADSKVLQGAGLVSGALWTDLDGDGFPELVLACEWGALRIFARKQGPLREVTSDWGLDRLTGWWNGVSAGDFDGDGRMDLVASNWGLNTPYRASPSAPRRLWFADFDGNGTLDLVESAFDPTLGKWVPTRDLDTMATAMPFLRAHFATHQSYAEASVQEIFSLASAKVVEVNTLASMVFLNRGHHFEGILLPPEAQWSPAFGVTVADFDGDGQEDLVLSQNFFATQPQTPRYDAGRGLLLKGDGTGHFSSLSSEASGIRVYGEQRACASADYDQDGRVDLVLTQNAGATKLFRNTGAKPGLTVRLAGKGGNPDGIGAVLRLRFHGRSGPAREIHAGSGYWSQDGAVQILATPEPPNEIEVRWPGGKTTVTALPATVHDIQIDSTGRLEVRR